MSYRPKIDYRAKSHLSYFAYLIHRISGLVLAATTFVRSSDAELE